jgi:hypothetical protein
LEEYSKYEKLDLKDLLQTAEIVF